MALFGLPSLTAALGRAGLVRMRPNFELAFSQVQDTVSKRINSRIDKIESERTKEDRIVADLTRELKGLEVKLPFLDRYHFDVYNNGLKLDKIIPKLNDLVSNFSIDGDVDDFTQNEIDTFKAAREDVIEDIRRLYVVTYPELANTKDIYYLQQAARALEAFEPTVGAVDPEGTESPNVNRQLVDFIEDIENRASVARTASSETASLALDMRLDIQKQQAEIESQRIELTVFEAQKKLEEINSVKASYANLLKALSLSYENSFSQLESLNNNLDLDRRPAPGSVLNIIS